MKKIILMGFYGGVNFGDEVILESIFSLYKEELSRSLLTIACTKPEYIINRFSVRGFKLDWRMLNLIHFYYEMKNNNLLIVGGGGLLQDYGNFPPKAILVIMPKVLIARLLGKPVIFLSIGLGPIDTRMGKVLTGIISKLVNLITVRNIEDKEILFNLGLNKKKIHVLPDPGFGMNTILKKRKRNYIENNKCFGIAILPFFKQAHNEHYNDKINREVMIKVCNHLIEEKDYSITFFPCSEEGDNEENLDIINGVYNKNRVKTIYWNIGNRINYKFFYEIDFLIAMRLHPQILASFFGIPFISIIYHPKIKRLLKMLDYCDYACDLTSVTAERILFLVEKLESDKNKISKKLIRRSNIISNDLFAKSKLIRRFL